MEKSKIIKESVYMEYRVLVNVNDYDYVVVKKNKENIFWHDYSKHGYLLNVGDVLYIIADGHIQIKYCVKGERKFAKLEDAMNDKEVYRNWKNNFERYFKVANGRFLELECMDNKLYIPFNKEITNHSIQPIKD